MRKLFLSLVVAFGLLGTMTACNTAAGVVKDVDATATCVVDAVTGLGCSVGGIVTVQ